MLRTQWEERIIDQPGGLARGCEFGSFRRGHRSYINTCTYIYIYVYFHEEVLNLDQLYTYLPDVMNLCSEAQLFSSGQ